MIDFVCFCSNIRGYTEATGIGNVLGNKGGVVVSLLFRHTSLCFVSSHLAAHQEHTATRNANYKAIVKNIKAGSAADSDICNQHHHVFWMGDLNYRLNYGDQATTFDRTPTVAQFGLMVKKINTGQQSEYDDLFQYDQLLAERQAHRVFFGFQEGKMTFAPTFKVRRRVGVHYSAQRSPAWCDRILWKSIAGYPIQQLSFTSAPDIATSDHKPVSSVFQVETLVASSPFDP